MTKLSPAAQAVRDAAFEPWETLDKPELIAAAALRAAVEQVMPEEPEHAYAEDYELGVFDARLDARNHFLFIAAELEAQ
jgi:hypothetical protein